MATETFLGSSPDKTLGSANWRGPPPRFHESVWSVLQKLSYLNALDHADMRRLFSPRTRTSDIQPSEPRWMGWCDLRRLRANIPRHCENWPWWAAAPHQRTNAPWESGNSAQVLRYCTSCMECGFHSDVFQMPALERCPEHDEPLRDSCPGCNQSVLYGPLANFTESFHCCCCGYALWQRYDRPDQWYWSVDRHSRLDAFVRRLMSVVESEPVYFRIHQHAVGFAQGVHVLDRLAIMSPAQLRKLPRVYWRFLNEDVMAGCAANERLDLSHAFEPMRRPLIEWCADLVNWAERHVNEVLGAHRSCIKEMMEHTEREGALLRPRQCAVANAVGLWRTQWRTAVVQHEVFRLVWAHVCSTLFALRRHGAVSFPEVVEPHLWPELWNVIGQRMLMHTLLEWVMLCEHLLSKGEGTPGAPLSPAMTQTPRVLSDLVVPPLFACLTPNSACMDVFHEGDVFLRRLNHRGCRARGTQSQSRPTMASAAGNIVDTRQALDAGLTFAQLVQRAVPSGKYIARAQPRQVLAHGF